MMEQTGRILLLQAGHRAYDRTVIGIAPSNENIVYFWTYSGSGTTKTELWKYDASGAGTWTDLTTNLPAPDPDPISCGYKCSGKL